MTTTAPGAIPFLAPLPDLSIERDTPPAVRDRNTRERQAYLELARDAARAPRTAAGGCRPSDMPGGSPGAPPPQIAPRILGHHVEVVVTYASTPRSAACRPLFLDVVVYSGKKSSASFNNAGGVGHYLLRGQRGRIVLDIPWGGKPPYRVSVNSRGADDRRGPGIERALTCPVTGETIRGCLAGYLPAPHEWTMPEPVLRIRGLNRSTLEASLRHVLEGEQWAPLTRAVRCSTLRQCEVTFVDASFSRSPYRVQYRIAGEQISGCWMALRGRFIDERPYPDAGGGRLQLAGCAAWAR